jgi:GNAT superfamily N-acetyltransferase
MTVTVHPLDHDTLDAAFEIATAVFVEGSSLHRALAIELNEYRAYLRPAFEAMVREGLSVVARENGRIVGCLIATDFHGQSVCSPGVPEKFAPLVALTNALCRRYPRVTSAGEVLLVDMAAVLPDAAGQGIYRRMRELATNRARHRGFRTVVGELSSAATQHVVVDILGHAIIAEVAFEDFRFGDKTPFSAIAKPRTIILTERLIEGVGHIRE